MHIITGLLITALLGKQVKGHGEQKRSPLLTLKWPIETQHLLPGRVRFRVPSLVGNDEALQRLEGQLPRVDGIDEVTANRISGSVVIRYQSEKISPDLLFAALIRLLGLEKELERTPKPALAKELRQLGEAMNRAVYSSTDGFVDLWTVVPLALMGLGVGKIIQDRSLTFPTGFTLIWWAYMALFRGKSS